MSLITQSLRGLSIEGAVPIGGMVTLITQDGVVNVPWSTMRQEIVESFEERINSLELSGSAPSIWPSSRTITLSGAVSGSVAIDGSQNVTMATSIADGSIAQAKVAGLTAKLAELTSNTSGALRTGYTVGSQPSTTAADPNTFTGATFLHVQETAPNRPAGLTTGLTVITVGPLNSTHQLGLANGRLWMRGETAGTRSPWFEIYHSGNLDPSTLLLKTDVAGAATKLATARSFSLAGVVTATGVNFDGTGSVTLNTTIDDGALAMAKVSGLTDALGQRLGFKGALTAALNTVTAPGIYWQVTPASATTSNNYPTANAVGQLLVTNDGTFVHQTYRSTGGRAWWRTATGGTWSAWAQYHTSQTFDPGTKLDTAGGTITGALTVNGALQANGNIRTPRVVAVPTGSDVAYTAELPDIVAPRWLLAATNVVSGSDVVRGGLYYGTDYIGIASTRVSGGAYLGIHNDGTLRYKGLEVLHGGNFDPAAPVPVGGLLNVGSTSGTHLRLRHDGRYSIDGGTTWREFNEASGIVSDPAYVTVRVGSTQNVQFFTEAGDSDTLQVRTGNATDGFKYFQLASNGDLRIPDGRVLISGQEAWHAGNFNPATKLDSSATATAATKLATARTINGVAFDGTTNITVPSNVNPADFVPVIQSASAYGSADDLTGKLAYAVCGSSALGTPAPWMTTWNFGDNASRDGQFSWGYGETNALYFRARRDNPAGWKSWEQIWTSTSFNPSSKLNTADPFATGTLYVDVNGTSSGRARVTAWNDQGVAIDAVNHDGSAFAPLNLRGSSVTINDQTAWNAGNFNPATKLDSRPSLGESCGVPPDNDWNNALSNGWFMAVDAANSPAAGWLMGETIVHNADWVQQTVFSVTEGGNSFPLRRWRLAGTWTGWTDTIRFKRVVSSRLDVGYDPGADDSIGCSNWFRASGPTGLFLASYGSGIYSDEVGWVKTYNNSSFKSPYVVGEGGATPNPNVNPGSARFRAYGNYGGGYSMIDSTGGSTWWFGGGQMYIGISDGETAGYSATMTYTKQGLLVANDFGLHSDPTMKKDMRPLEFRGALEPFTYRWRKQYQNKLKGEAVEIGFNAAKVQELYPEVVDRTASGKLSLSYPRLTAILAAQNNEQQVQLDRQASELRELRDALAEQKKLVAQILARLGA